MPRRPTSSRNTAACGVPCPVCLRRFKSERGLSVHNTKTHIGGQRAARCLPPGDESPLPRPSSTPMPRPAGIEEAPLAAATTTPVLAPHPPSFLPTLAIRSEPDDCAECQLLHHRQRWEPDMDLPFHDGDPREERAACDDPTHHCLARFVSVLRDEFFRGVVGDERRHCVPSVIREVVFLGGIMRHTANWHALWQRHVVRKLARLAFWGPIEFEWIREQVQRYRAVSLEGLGERELCVLEDLGRLFLQCLPKLGVGIRHHVLPHVVRHNGHHALGPLSCGSPVMQSVELL